MQSVSVIGLGAMGTELARALLQNGYGVTIWNRSPEKAAPLVDAGAKPAASASDAIRASDVTITCIRSHGDTRALLGEDPPALTGKTIVELSTGGSGEAKSLMDWVRASGADCLIGMISVFPKDIGDADSAILAVGSEDTWSRCEPVLKTLAGKSARIGENPIALAAIYASLVLPRQGFMFGMIYGALVCRAAGIPLEVFAEQIPVSLGVMPSYYQYFAETVPGGKFDDPPASMATYADALDDALSTFEATGAAAELPKLFSDLAHRGVDAGLQDKALTALVELLGSR